MEKLDEVSVRSRAALYSWKPAFGFSTQIASVKTWDLFEAENINGQEVLKVTCVHLQPGAHMAWSHVRVQEPVRCQARMWTQQKSDTRF